MLDMADVDDMICYYRALEDRNFAANACGFLNNTNKTILSVGNFSLVVDRVKLDELNMENKIIIIDNTGFPENGAYGINDVSISSNFYFEIHPSNTFYHWTLGCKNTKKKRIIIYKKKEKKSNKFQ